MRGNIITLLNRKKERRFTMSSVLRTALIIIFVVCLIGIYVSGALWASGGGCCGGGNSDKKSGVHPDQTMTEVKSEKADVIKDPVCGMEINDLKKSLSTVYKEKDYYFCSEYCKKTFKNDPASYTSATAHQHGEGGGHKH